LPAIEEKKLQGYLLERRMQEALARQMTARQTDLHRIAGVLRTLNPEATLARGYTITTDEKGQPLSSAQNVAAGMVLKTRFHDGETESIARS
jgi:exodeoxyribonuclease VII large subunit